MTTINNMLMKFPGIFENKEVRIKDGYISVLDIIQTCSGCKKESTRKLWQRIKNEYNDIVTDCHVIKFNGKKQKETPCIKIMKNAVGLIGNMLFKKLNLIFI